MASLRLLMGYLFCFMPAMLHAKTYTLQYGQSKTCIIHLNQVIDSVEYKELNNTKVDIDTQKYKTLKIHFKNNHKATAMVIVSGQQRHKIIYKYNKYKRKPCALFIKNRKKSSINLSQFSTEISNTKQQQGAVSVELKQLKYIHQHMIIELKINNQKSRALENCDFEISTFKRRGFLALKTKPIKYFRNFKSTCNAVAAKSSKTCHILIKNFYKKGYGLSLKVYIDRNKNKDFQLYHKFNS
ncbi:hypothetical protein MRY82_00340 [bacterium]|nr:hypothetical protein [bacterium]